MKLIACKACENQISPSAKACPACGHEIKRTSKGAWIATALMIPVVIITLAHSGGSNSAGTTNPAPTTAQQAAQAKKAATDISMARATVALGKSMRNPDSFKLRSAVAMDDGAGCFEYQAQNGFGGMNIGYAILSPDGKLHPENSPGFARLWKKECDNKQGIEYAAGS